MIHSLQASGTSRRGAARLRLVGWLPVILSVPAIGVPAPAEVASIPAEILFQSPDMFFIDQSPDLRYPIAPRWVEEESRIGRLGRAGPDAQAHRHVEWNTNHVPAVAGGSGQTRSYTTMPLVRRPVHYAIANLSPDGRYFIGQQWRQEPGKVGKLLTFCLDLQTKRPVVLSDGVSNTIITAIFASEERIVLRFDNGQLYSVKPDGTDQIHLIGYGEVETNAHLRHATILSEWPEEPDHILLPILPPGEKGEKRIAREFGVEGPIGGLWKLHVTTAESTRLIADESYTQAWWLDAEGRPALALDLPGAKLEGYGKLADEQWELNQPRRLRLIRDNAYRDALPLDPGLAIDNFVVEFADPVFNPGRGTLAYLAQTESDGVALMEMDLETGARRVVTEDPRGDLVQLLRDPNNRRLVGYETQVGRGGFVFLDRRLDAVQRGLAEGFPGEQPRLLDWDRDLKFFLFAVDSPHRPGRIYLLDRLAGQVEPVLDQFPWLRGRALRPTEPITFSARDGLALDGYLTHPRQHQTDSPPPLVLLVHDGLWQRDTWRFDPLVQFLAARGYAVLQVNFRGSRGYGRAFLEAGNKEWGGTMQDDLEDGVDWAIAQGFADSGRVAVMGFQYGGYAALTALMQSPERFAAGIGFEGFYDLAELAKGFIKIERRGTSDRFEDWRERVGDYETERATLEERSPFHHPERIQDPVLLLHPSPDKRLRSSTYQMNRVLGRSPEEVRRVHFDPDFELPGEDLNTESDPAQWARRNAELQTLRLNLFFAQAVADFLSTHLPPEHP